VLCAAQNLCWNDNKRNGNPLVRWIILEEHRTTPPVRARIHGGGSDSMAMEPRAVVEDSVAESVDGRGKPHQRRISVDGGGGAQ
jgi:hypothetical protein